jgi:hypothetical protein
MTGPDWDHFVDLFESLSRAFNKPVTASTPKQARDYFDYLSDYPLPVVEQAKADLIRGSKFFPKIFDWRRACDVVRAAEPTPAVVMYHQLEDGSVEPVYCCATCQDTGWRPACGCRFGDMDSGGECPRHPRTANGGLVYRQAMSICECREGNPAYQASRPKVRAYASERSV